MKALQGRRSLPVHEVRAVVVVHGLRLVQPHRPLEIMTSFRRLVTGVDHPIVVIIIITELLRDGQRFAHRHDRQLAPAQ